MFADTRSGRRRHGLDVVRISHVYANRFGDQLSGNFIAAIADVLRTHASGGTLAASVQRVVDIAEFA
jgi:hypothetical protein